MAPPRYRGPLAQPPHAPGRKPCVDFRPTGFHRFSAEVATSAWPGDCSAALSACSVACLQLAQRGIVPKTLI